jgi:hypothetical protein
MTEEEWLACADPSKMLRMISSKATERKLRLFTVACCRRIRHLLDVEECQRAVEVAERYADGQADADELDEARRAATENIHIATWFRDQGCALSAVDRATRRPEAVEHGWNVDRRFSPAGLAEQTADSARSAATSVGAVRSGRHVRRSARAVVRESRCQADFLRCILGNPFRPVSFESASRTPTVLSLATSSYTERDFGTLPILADALEDAGCDNFDILDHCRQPGGHVRGCWVIDLLLGKG